MGRAGTGAYGSMRTDFAEPAPIVGWGPTGAALHYAPAGISAAVVPEWQ